MEPTSSFDEVKQQESNASITYKVESILDQLSDSEMEAAACASYMYQKLHNVDGSIRRSYAYQMVERYVSSKSDPEIALSKLRATLQFRSEMKLDRIEQLTDESNIELTKYISDRKAVVQGYDRDGRSTLVFTPRLSRDHNNLHQTVLGKVWTLEKAVACTRSLDRTINVIVDFEGFSLFSHSPPLKVGKAVMDILRKHYVGHIHKIFLMNVPTSFSILWSIFKPFAGSKTTEKMVFVDSEYSPKKDIEVNTDSLHYYYSDIQSTPWMRNDQDKCHTVNVDNYLNSLPFDEAW